MDIDKVRKYIGKQSLIILNNGFKFTGVIPDFDGSSFDMKDKFEHNVTIECEMISLICEKDEVRNGKG